jgi:SNF2 family DNA or RNA helicase
MRINNGNDSSKGIFGVFKVGDLVCRKNNPEIFGKIRKVNMHGMESMTDYEILWPSEGQIKYHTEDDIQLWEDSSLPMDPIKCFFDKKIGNYASFLRTMTRERLSTPGRHSKGKILSDQILAFNASRTLFYPYQYKPLVKYISSAEKRVLICDEVGLGKTIEAGLIVLENMARVPTERVLVVCPSSLREKWEYEMKNRFALKFSIFKTSELANIMELITEENEENLFAIVSYECARSDRVINFIENEGFTFDMVIFDEAHRLRNQSTRQHKAAKALCDASDGVIMLTATPIQLKINDLISLLRLLLPCEFSDEETTKLMLDANEYIVKAQTLVGKVSPDVDNIDALLGTASKLRFFEDNPLMNECRQILSKLRSNPCEIDLILKLQENLAELNLIGHVYTRTKKREVMTKTVKRNPHVLSIQFSDEERLVYDRVLDTVRSAIEIKHPLMVSWIMNNIERRVASCIPAALEYFREMIDDVKPYDEEEYEYYYDDSMNGEAAQNEQKSAVAKFYEVLKTKEWIRGRYNDASVGDLTDSKAPALFRCIEELRAEGRDKIKLIVFSSFRKTLSYLSRQLNERGYEVYTIHGGVPIYRRSEIINKFRDDISEVSILLSSRVGGEGLDMQFTDIMLNYDLPWNPMEVEQRIGRIDRIGQESSSIDIYHLFLEDSLEEKILNRLYERVGIFEGAIGELEPILGSVVKEVMGSIISNKPSQNDIDDSMDRITRIIASHKKDLGRLEKDSANFIGTDSFFTEEVKRIENRHLYITPEQMRLFFENFLAENCPTSRWEYDSLIKTGNFRPGHDFSEIQQKFFKDDKNIVHRQFMAGRKYQITFDRDTAYKLQGKVEFVNNLHPLAHLMMRVFEHAQKQGNASFDSAFHILIEENSEKFEIGAGTYIFEIWRIEIDACNPQNRLEFVILDGEKQSLRPSKSAELFAYILDNGRDWRIPLPSFNEGDENWEIVNDYHERLKNVIFERAHFLKEEMERKNTVFLEKRKASLAMTYQRKRESLEAQIERRKAKGESEKTLRLPIGQLQKLDGKYKIDIESLEEKRDVSENREFVAFGVLEICEKNTEIPIEAESFEY